MFQKSIRDGLIYMTIQLTDGRVELIQKIDQFVSNSDELDAHLNEKREVSYVQSLIFMDDDQLVKQKEELKPLLYLIP